MQQPVFVAKVRGEVCAHFHAVAVKRYSSMRNWLFGLPGRILYEQSPCCQRKWWTCSWLCSSLVSTFSVLVSLNVPFMAHAFFPGRLSNHCHVLHRTFSEICTKFVAVPLSDPSRNRIRPDIWLQIKGHTNQHVHPAAWNLYTASQYMLVLSSTVTSCYCNCCTDNSTNPEIMDTPRSRKRSFVFLLLILFIIILCHNCMDYDAEKLSSPILGFLLGFCGT
jgi:hypothetical protein